MARELMKGNIAVAEGAIRAGCDAYFGYPITPQNELIAHMSKRMIELDRAFVQAESEVSAINMVFGAAVCGKKSMTSSSSPGISLKQEGISYLAGCELPAVIVNVQRGGPGLGNISGAQGDYFQSTKGGGHGDYKLIVYAPFSVEEMFLLTYNSFKIAFKYRNPVMILTDGVIGQMVEPVELDSYPSISQNDTENDWELTGCVGREPRLIKSLFMQEGALEKHNIELQKKYSLILKNETKYEEYLTQDADIIIVAYGISARIALSAVHDLRKQGVKVGLFRPITLWPFPEKALNELADKTSLFITIEQSLGQMVQDVKLAINGKANVEFYGRAGGGLFDTNEIVEKVKEIGRQL